MPTHFEKRIVPYSCRQMFDLVADIERYPSFLPWCQEALVKTISDTERHAVLRVGYKAFHDTFTSLVTLDPHHTISVKYGGGPLRSLETNWQFAPVDPSGCEISFFLDFSFKSPLLGSMMDLFFDHAFKRMVTAFLARAAVLYPLPRESRT